MPEINPADGHLLVVCPNCGAHHHHSVQTVSTSAGSPGAVQLSVQCLNCEVPFDVRITRSCQIGVHPKPPEPLRADELTPNDLLQRLAEHLPDVPIRPGLMAAVPAPAPALPVVLTEQQPQGVAGDTTPPQVERSPGVWSPRPLAERVPLEVEVRWDPKWGSIDQWRLYVLGAKAGTKCECCGEVMRTGEQPAWLPADQSPDRVGRSMHYSCLQWLRRELADQVGPEV